jgi:aminopeptidase N
MMSHEARCRREAFGSRWQRLARHTATTGALLAGTAWLASPATALAQRLVAPGRSVASRSDPMTSLLAPGVSAALAQYRSRTLRDVRYDVTLSLPASRAQPVTGQTLIRVHKRTSGPLVLDFDVTPTQPVPAEVNGIAIDALQPTRGHLVVPERHLRIGENIIRLTFTPGDVPLNRNDDFMYTVFVPARARQALPVFDQPDLKAHVTLTLEMPADWRAVANGVETLRERIGSAGSTTGASSINAPSGIPLTHSDSGRVRVKFAATKPLPTYLLAFAAGRFEVDSASRNGRQFRIFHRERDSAKVARNRDAIYDLHAQSLAYMESYTGIPYPWGKFDIFLAPAFQFGGMEHAGAIFYNASGLMLDASATQSQQLGRASVIAHETAHLWFGDLVTMRWFDDVWLKEVFANFYAAKIVNPAFPEVNHALRFLLAHYPTAYDVDRTDGANPIRQPLDNLADAGSLYGAIIYQKAPIMMRQLELLVGERTFQSAMREYLSRHAFGNATWPDLVAMLDRRTPTDLRAWSSAWVSAPGRPTLTVALKATRGDSVRVLISQSDARGRGLIWPQRIAVGIGRSEGIAKRADGAQTRSPAGDTSVMLTLRGTALTAFTAARVVQWVLPSADGLAYGDVVLDSLSRRNLRQHFMAFDDPLQRGSALVTLWEEMQGARITPLAMREALTSLLAHESNELLIQRALGYLENLWSRWLTPAARLAFATAHEQLLRDGLARAPTASARLTWFRAIMRIAQTEGTATWLQRVWARTDSVPGLTLSEDDESQLALQLAVRDVPQTDSMLDTQLTRITNPDRKARMTFVRRAVAATAAERAAMFATLQDVNNRRREPWVLEAMSLLHHPLRADASAPLVAPALELLEEIQRTGDIFLPKRWVDVTLSGHRSDAVAATVRQYLASHPSLAPRLRAIVLQSADELFRVTTPAFR